MRRTGSGRLTLGVSMAVGGLATSGAMLGPVLAANDHAGWYVGLLISPIAAGLVGAVAAAITGSGARGLLVAGVGGLSAGGTYLLWVLATADPSDPVGPADALAGFALVIPSMAVAIPMILCVLGLQSLRRGTSGTH